MTCELRPGLVKPIDALIKYFLEIKPYHTKLLEVIERYRFVESITVSFEENHLLSLTKNNKALCGPVGFGLEWDEDCGFDAVECCDLFECIGGYGLIYDNSDLLVDLPISSLNTSNDSFTISGDHTNDVKIPIWDITASDTIKLNGNFLEYFETHKLFLIIPYSIFDIDTITPNSFFVNGNKASEFSRKEFRVTDSRYNNGVYAASLVRYLPDIDKTEIKVSTTLNLTSLSGKIEVKSSNRNNGVYQVESFSYDGIFTTITINSSNVLNHINDSVHGSIQLRTGFIAPRRIWHFNPDDSQVTEYKIVNTVYDIENDNTVVVVAEKIHQPIDGNGDLRIYGYRFGAGFDGFNECTPPKPYNIHTNFGESLNIVITRIGE